MVIKKKSPYRKVGGIQYRWFKQILVPSESANAESLLIKIGGNEVWQRNGILLSII
jgi:hypothetical protein